AAHRRDGARYRRRSDHKHQRDRQPRQADAPRASRRLQIATQLGEMNTSCSLDPRPTSRSGHPSFGRQPRQAASLSSGDKEEAVTEALIRQRIQDYANAISAKDIDGAMSFFAPDLVSFDIASKTLRYVGADNKRRAWQNVFATYGSIAYEIRD